MIETLCWTLIGMVVSHALGIRFPLWFWALPFIAPYGGRALGTLVGKWGKKNGNKNSI